MTIIRIIQGDVLKGLAILPDESVHCVVTSPPYWGLRDYGVEGQIGLEATPEEYVEKMVAVFRGVRRVLRKDGTVWLNMGDCYSGSGKGPSCSISQPCQDMTDVHSGIIPCGLKPKDLLGMPWRLAFALQADGWWLRSDIVWSKPNPMPESVTDRPTKSHEYLFLLAKSARYFYDADAIREPHKEPERGNGHSESIGTSKGGTTLTSGFSQREGGWADSWSGVRQYNINGRNRRTVWEIPTQPFPETHFATFPEALVEPCIKAGTSERGCCSKCGAPWERVVEKGEPDEEWKKECGADSTGDYRGQSEKFLKQDALGKQTYTGFNARYKAKQQNASDVKRRILEGMRERISRWEPDCQCGGEPVPCIVLDPFAGSGTVAKVARDLGRTSIMIELSPAYVGIMKKRLRLGEQLFQVSKVEQAE